MAAPRFKPILRWEPFPYLVLVVLLLATGVIRPDSPPWLLWPLVVCIGGVLAWVFVAMAAERRPRNPNQWGELSSLEGLRIVDVDRADRTLRTVAPVEDTGRHRTAIELARLHGGTEQGAVLVPRASRWLSMRYRVGVELVGGDRPHHAGFLPAIADDRWRDLLDAELARGRYVRVPALITGDEKPFDVELDLSGLEGLEALERPDRSEGVAGA